MGRGRPGATSEGGGPLDPECRVAAIGRAAKKRKVQAQRYPKCVLNPNPCTDEPAIQVEETFLPESGLAFNVVEEAVKTSAAQIDDDDDDRVVQNCMVSEEFQEIIGMLYQSQKLTNRLKRMAVSSL
jgi:hypothetical protein